ncbi:hypothetical protein Q8A67_023313 [Cirrhinus molitorella]|uniref:Uncharacterized protein n=1 Tax=Cirrhinus molitorella TaxID=172907 RepID=A0AA88TB41_9TELE|nr:hypothetical protein Q8A67_023313 [Cirrhinus molitorella]
MRNQPQRTTRGTGPDGKAGLRLRRELRPSTSAPEPRLQSRGQRCPGTLQRPIQSTFVSHLEAGRGSVKEALSPIEHNCRNPPSPSLTTLIIEEPGPDQHVCECFQIRDARLKGASSRRKTREEGTLHLGFSFSC